MKGITTFSPIHSTHFILVTCFSLSKYCVRKTFIKSKTHVYTTLRVSVLSAPPPPPLLLIVLLILFSHLLVVMKQTQPTVLKMTNNSVILR